MQNEHRGKLIVYMIAHSTRLSLHRFWGSLSRIKRYLKRPDYYDQVTNITEDMEQIIRELKNNVELTMYSPGIVVYPEMEPSDMELEEINLTAIIQNILDPLTPRQNPKTLLSRLVKI